MEFRVDLLLLNKFHVLYMLYHSRRANQPLATVGNGPLAESDPPLLLVGRRVDVLLVHHVVRVVVGDVEVVRGELGLRRRPPPLHRLDHDRLHRESRDGLRRDEHGRRGGRAGGGRGRQDGLLGPWTGSRVQDQLYLLRHGRGRREGPQVEGR